MKKISYLFVIASITTLLSFFAYSKINNPPLNKKVPVEYEASIYVAVGTYLWDGCTGHNPCGPCCGICIRGGKRPKKVDGAFQGIETVAEGEGAFKIIDISTNTVTLKFLTNGLSNGTQTGLEENFELGNEIASSYGYNNITLKKGFYSVDFTSAQYGIATFDAIIIP